MTPVVPMLCELLRVALPGHDIAQDAQTGHAGDVADDQRELHVHLDQRLRHPLHERARTLDQRGPLPEKAAQGDDAVGRTQAPLQQPADMQVPEPFAVGDITLPARTILHVTSVDEADLEAARLEDLEERRNSHASWDKDRSVGRRLVDAFNESERVFEAAQRQYPYNSPWLIADVEDAARLMGTDYHAHGFEKNREAVETFCRSAFEDGLTTRQLTAEEFFADFLKG